MHSARDKSINTLTAEIKIPCP